MKIRTQLKAGGVSVNHNEALRRESERPAIAMRKQLRTSGRENDRLKLLVVRAGLRAGFGRASRFARVSRVARTVRGGW